MLQLIIVQNEVSNVTRFNNRRTFMCLVRRVHPFLLEAVRFQELGLSNERLLLAYRFPVSHLTTTLIEHMEWLHL